MQKRDVRRGKQTANYWNTSTKLKQITTDYTIVRKRGVTEKKPWRSAHDTMMEKTRTYSFHPRDLERKRVMTLRKTQAQNLWASATKRSRGVKTGIKKQKVGKRKAGENTQGVR